MKLDGEDGHAVESGQASKNDIFKPRGLAIQDISTASKVYELPVKKSVGDQLAL
jgi:ornithine cyclodeaminase/alanine dehydrogenase-like protein (mu-crystallin family)